MPLRKDWVVLDGLNHIKDHLDGTLSFRWSCRMGICGSCGMTVNGEPKLTCATFLTDYAPGPIRVEPLRNFPVVRDLVVDIGDFMAKLPTVKPWIIREDEKPLAEGEYLQTPERAGRVQAVQHVHQLHAVLLGLPGLRPRPELHRAGGDRAGAALQPRLAGPGRRGRDGRPRRTTGSGAARSSASAPRPVPKDVDPAGAIQRYKLTAANATMKYFLLPRGSNDRRDEGRTPRVDAPVARPAAYRAHMPILWWLRRRSYLLFVVRELSSVFVAWFVVYLLLLVARWRGAKREYQRFLDRSGNPWVLAVNVIALLFVLFHAVTWFDLAPKRCGEPAWQAVPPRLIAVAHYAAWVVLSAVVAWIVLG